MPPNAYATFVKDHIHEFKHLDPKDRMRECAKKYHQMKGTTATTRKMPKVVKRKMKRGGSMVTPSMTASGGNFFDDFVHGFTLPFKAAASILPLVTHLL